MSELTTWLICLFSLLSFILVSDYPWLKSLVNRERYGIHVNVVDELTDICTSTALNNNETNHFKTLESLARHAMQSLIIYAHGKNRSNPRACQYAMDALVELKTDIVKAFLSSLTSTQILIMNFELEPEDEQESSTTNRSS